MPMKDILAQLAESKELTQETALAARQWVYKDGRVDPQEAEFLFALDEAAERRDPAWTALFVESLVDLVVRQMQPFGYVSPENADWLITRISRDGLVKTETELELLVKVLEVAKSSPARLSAFALDQVKAAIVDGEGPLAGGGRLQPGRVSRAEAELMRRILYAFGGDGHVAVTREEAEVLFDINDATAEAENDPAWTDLFVKAVASCLMAASGYKVPTREEALRQEEWLDNPSGGVPDFLASMFAGGLRGVLAAYRQPGLLERWAERNRYYRLSVVAAERVTEHEAEWLSRRIGRDGVLHDNEMALLRFIREESPDVHPSLKPLLDRVA